MRDLSTRSRPPKSAGQRRKARGSVTAANAGSDPILAMPTRSRAFPTGSEAARANARLDANGILF
jgi:hypothetical protein